MYYILTFVTLDSSFVNFVSLVVLTKNQDQLRCNELTRNFDCQVKPECKICERGMCLEENTFTPLVVRRKYKAYLTIQDTKRTSNQI